MINKLVLEYFPLIDDINDQYVFFRTEGWSPEEAQGKIINAYADELNDYDESVVVLSGIALAQWDTSELEENTKQEVLLMLEKKIAEAEKDEERRAFRAVLKNLSKEKKSNKRITPSSRKSYSLDWSIGDTFAHKLTHPNAEKAGIFGCYLLFRKIGQYNDWKGRTIQLGYVTVCSDNHLPKTTEELNALGFLRVMSHGEKWEYMVQVNIQSKRTENTLKLEWIGCFPDALTPNDEIVVEPRVTMPFYDGTDKASNCPRYEDSCCHFYKKNGIGGI